MPESKNIPQKGASDYGDKVQAEREEAITEAAQAIGAKDAPDVSPGPTPPEEEEAPQEEQEGGQEGDQEEAAAGAAQGPSSRITSLMQLVPPELLNRPAPAKRPKTAMNKSYDVGMLWQVLAESPDASPAIKAIAKRLMGE